MKRTFTKLMAALALLLFIAPPMVVWGQTYKKVTSAPSNWSGEYLLVYENNSTAYVWTGVDATSCYKTATISNGVVTKPTDAVSITLASMTGGYSVKVNGGTNDGKYTSNASSNGITFNANAVANTLTYENSATTISCGGKKFRYNKTSGQTRFRYFGSEQEKVQLYKKAYTVTYNANGGSGTMTDSNSPYFENSTVTTLTNTFEYVGQNFSGWNTAADGSGTSYDEGEEFTITANTTLYAQWQPAGNYIIVSPTIANVDEDGGNIEFSVSTDQTLGDNPVVFYETSEGTTTTTTPGWITEIIYMEGELVVTVAANSSVARTAYFKVENSTVQSDVVTVNQAAITVATPEFDVATGTYYEDQLVDITCATNGATIYYTTDGTTPAANSTEYDGNGVEITETTTLKAIAIKNNVSSEVASATYTIIHPLTTMDAIFEAATEAGSTATSHYVTFNNWVVTGVKNSQAFVTDGTKGFIIYKSNHGFAVGHILSGTVQASLMLFNGSAEFTTLTSSTSGLTVTTGGTATPQEVTIDAMSGVNTGALIQLKGVTYNGTVLVDANNNTITPYTTLYSGSYTPGTKYNVVGVYQQQTSAPHRIMPRNANDIVAVLDPTISVNPSSAATFSYIVGGGPSEEQVFEVTGSFLTSDDIIVSVPENCAFEITDNEEYGHTVTIGSGDAFSVRMKANLEVSDEYSATLTITNDGAETVSMPLTGSVTYAHVTYDGNGEGVTNVPTDNNNYSYNNQVTVLGAGEMTKEGYDFVWWTPTQDGSGDDAYVENDQFSITSDVTLYAQWDAKSYNITKAAMTNGDVTVKVGENVVTSATTGTTVTLVVAPATNYALSELVVAKTGDPTTIVTVTNNQFVMPPYAVTVSATFVEHYSKDIDFENAVATYSEWTFQAMTSKNTDNNVSAHSGDYFGTTGAGDPAYIQTKNKIANPQSITCFVTRRTTNNTSSNWKIQVSSDGSTWTTVGNTQSAISMNVGTWVEITRDLSSYQNVYVRVHYSGSTATRCIDDLSLTYTPAASNALSVATVDHGTITATVGSTTVAEGESLNVENLTVVTLNAEADVNYQFDSWSVYKTGDLTTTVEVDANNQFTMPAYPVTVSASFNETCTLTYSVNGNASNVVVVKGSEITLTAPTDNIPSGFDFIGWTSNPANVADLVTSLTMNANATVYAVFGKSNVVEITRAYFGNSYPTTETDYQICGITFTAKQVASYTNTTFQFKNDPNGYLYNKTALSNLVSIVATQDGTYRQGMTLKYGDSAKPTDGTPISASHQASTMVDTYDLSGVTAPYIYMENTTGNMARYSKIVLTFANTDPARYTRVFLNETATADITIAGPSIVPSGSTLNMSTFTLSNTSSENAGNLVIEDGAQVKLAPNNGNVDVYARVLKNITGYGEGNGNWYLLSAPSHDVLNANPQYPEDCPIANLMPVDQTVNDKTVHMFDLYKFDQTKEEEWQNFRNTATVSKSFIYQEGRLYARKESTTLEFGVKLATSTNEDRMYYYEGKEFAGWSLIGNAMMCNQYVALFTGNHDYETTDYYRMNAAGTALELCENGAPVAPMEGIFVQTTNSTEEVFVEFSSTPIGTKSSAIDLNVSFNNAITDRARVRFGEGSVLGKFNFNENATKLYIPQGSKDYAVVRSNAQGEMPVNFRASKNGTYTFSVEPKNVEMAYLHLIDNKTGADVDLLATPSYSFEARTTDYANRFRLEFNTNGVEENNATANFAYFNGSSWTVNNMGEATLQVVDVMGRVLSTETISGNTEVNLNQASGVYMLRLVNGNDVKVQKVVVK